MTPPQIWRGVWAGGLVAVATVVAGVLATNSVDLPLRDPDHVAALYLVLVGFGVVLLVGVDVALRARARSGGRRPTRAAMAAVRRERWTPARCLAAGAALVAFYASYMAYRNLKAIVPLVRPGDNYDAQLADLDRNLFAGHDPAALLHTLLGNDVVTHVLSAFYVAWIVVLPLTIGVALVFATDLRPALFYVTAQSINWGLGNISYFLLPSLGPIYFDAGAFSNLSNSEVTRLQGVLLEQRVRLPRRPGAGDAAEHRGLRLAAHLHELHGRARRPPARARAAAADRAVGLGGHHDGRDRLPRLALLRRRHRRRGDGSARTRARARAHGHRPAGRARAPAARRAGRAAGLGRRGPARGRARPVELTRAPACSSASAA